MEMLALIAWLMTILGGLYMFGLTTRSGNTHSGATRSHLPSVVIFSHASLAVLGLAVWGVYMASSDSEVLAWASLGVLLLVASLGTFMFLRWRKDRSGSEAEVARNREELAEQQIPSFAVHAHGMFAGVTILLVLLVSLGVELSR